MTIVEVGSTTVVNYRYSGIQKAFTRYSAIFGGLDDRQQYCANAIFFHGPLSLVCYSTMFQITCNPSILN
jgi:hypothetical protein